MLLIVVAIAGLVFGRQAATGAIVNEFGDFMGRDSAKLLQTAIVTAAKPAHGLIASIVGIVTLLITASGVFGEMQSALNVIWKAEPKTGAISRLVRARTASLGLVAALGFLLLISLVVSTALNAFGNYLDTILPFAHALLVGLNFIISFTLLAVLFAAIYKVLPDRPLRWRDMIVGAMLTTLLFTTGKFLISFYLASSSIASGDGGRLADHRPAVGLLFRATFPVGRRVHESLCRLSCQRRPGRGSPIRYALWHRARAGRGALRSLSAGCRRRRFCLPGI